MANAIRLIVNGAMLVLVLPACAADDSDRYAWHLQATYVEQHVDHFRAPYSGSNSLTPNQSKQTADLTLFAGARIWPGAEIWINPELDQGFGLDDTTGLAGFSSGEAYKIGRTTPYLRWQRIFVRQTWNLEGDHSAIEAGPNQFSASVSTNRIVMTVGKFGVVDLFDTNRYAHDPRGDFLNWSILDTGSFDYAADAWGYTAGAALEWYRAPWAFRVGFFDVSDVPNSPHLEPGFDENQWIAELENRYTLVGLPGKLSATVFSTHARMALLSDAIAWGLTHGTPPDPAQVRRARERQGLSINVEQRVGESVAMFLRAGASGGNVETYDFTDIDRSLATGVTIDAARWQSARDTFALALVVNGISQQRRQYLAAGGLGLLVGDGQLIHAGNEQIIEGYYDLCALAPVHVTFDFQRVRNIAYSKDRGPASIIALRFHVQI